MAGSETESLGQEGPEPTACQRCGDFAELVDYDGHQICEGCIGRLSEIERTPPTLGNLLSGSLWVLGRIGLPAALIVALADLPMALIEVLVPDLPAILSTAYGATVSVVAQGVVLYLAHRAIRGERLDVGAAVRQAGDGVFNLVGANFLASLQVFLYALMLVIPGIVRGLSLTLALPIAINEDLSPMDALNASAARMKGHRFTAFFAYLAWGSVWMVAFAAYLAFTIALDTPGALAMSESVAMVLLVVSGILMPVLMVPVVCTTAVLYAKTLRYRAPR